LKPASAKQLQLAIDEALAPDTGSRVDPADQLALRLMAIDVAMSASPPDTASASAQLSAAGPLTSRSGISPEALGEFHYQALQLARISENYADLNDHVSWFLEQGGGSKFESAALISTAKSVDAMAGEAPSGDAAKLGLRIYRRLNQLLGDNREKLATNKNAQVALSRLAQYAYQLGEREESATALDKLLAAFPKDRGYLRRAGLVRFELNQFKEAINHWRRLVAGSRNGTEQWYEAKYYQIACLLEIDRHTAASVFEELQLIDPDLGPPEWREKFMGLQKRL
jgi:tetratricopeptide (TPR) repeat protein